MNNHECHLVIRKSGESRDVFCVCRKSETMKNILIDLQKDHGGTIDNDGYRLQQTPTISYFIENWMYEEDSNELR